MAQLIEVGKIKPIKSNETDFMKFGIGLEKLDRNVFDPSKTYDKLQQIGVKRVRIQSGWMRTEKTEGVYEFGWLDEIVDNLLVRGLKPWMCLCYGNPLYTEDARIYYGGVGCPPIKTEKERNAWANYCKAVTEHFKGRVDEYEVWNEPDGKHCWKHGINGTEYGEFVIATSKAVKEVNPEAKIYIGSCCNRYALQWLEAMYQTGAGDYADAITYHDYCENELRAPETVMMHRRLIEKYNPKLKLIMGETGCPSVVDGNGALKYGNWSEDKQAKLLLRRILVEMKNEVEFISWFTTVDMVEALYGTNDDKASNIDYGYFGVLGADFDENGFSTGEYTPKKSYYTLQNVCAVFDKVKLKELPVIFHWGEYTKKTYSLTDKWDDLISFGLEKANGACAFAYWKPTNVLTTSYEGFTTLITSMPADKIRITDLMTGKVYKIEEKNVIDKGFGVTELFEIPVRDYPLLVTFGDFFEMEE